MMSPLSIQQPMNVPCQQIWKCLALEGKEINDVHSAQFRRSKQRGCMQVARELPQQGFKLASIAALIYCHGP